MASTCVFILDKIIFKCVQYGKYFRKTAMSKNVQKYYYRVLSFALFTATPFFISFCYRSIGELNRRRFVFHIIVNWNWNNNSDLSAHTPSTEKIRARPLLRATPLSRIRFDSPHSTTWLVARRLTQVHVSMRDAPRVDEAAEAEMRARLMERLNTHIRTPSRFTQAPDISCWREADLSY